MRDKKKNKKSNFFYAFAFLPEEKREAMNLFYSFSRISDEIVDNELFAIEEKYEKFVLWEKEFHLALENKSENKLLLSLSKMINEYKIPVEYFFELLAGIKSDLNFTQPKMFDELERYAYSVASTVGLIIIHILGYKNDKAEQYAINLGKALQITNIMRDVRKDFENKRIYIPKELFQLHSLNPDDLAKMKSANEFRMMMQTLYEKAKKFYVNAWQIFPEEDYGTLYPAQAMGKIYYEILKKIKKADFDVFREEIKIPKFKKAFIVAAETLRGKATR